MMSIRRDVFSQWCLGIVYYISFKVCLLCRVPPSTWTSLNRRYTTRTLYLFLYVNLTLYLFLYVNLTLPSQTLIPRYRIVVCDCSYLESESDTWKWHLKVTPDELNCCFIRKSFLTKCYEIRNINYLTINSASIIKSCDNLRSKKMNLTKLVIYVLRKNTTLQSAVR